MIGFREKLAIGFAKLNKQGIFAAQNWMCCCTCGRYAIKTEMGLGDDATYVYYHDQREAELRDLEERGEPCEVRLDWNGDGEQICKILRESGLGVDWDGSNWIRVFDIQVKPATIGIAQSEHVQ
jgi:hypothetical protein